ncbi:hypothetical protein [Emcibacter nanhaiensis]|uniref:hypothetical protein n=1 Tax=Emcibacter nanhaiensis TaxID=1505037 RepID=UPI001C61225C|nr:hypothetical protein [Emcibacter nanhaiensis]
MTEKLTGLAIAMLLVGGLSSVAGSVLNTKETRRDFEFVGMNEAVDPVIRVEVVAGDDFVFHARQFMDERSAAALERSVEITLEQVEKVMSLHEDRLADLEESLAEVEEMERIPEALREEMRVEISLEIHRAEREVRRVVREAERLHAEKIAAAATAHAESVASSFSSRAASAAEVEPLPPVSRALPLPPISPEAHACSDKDKKSKEKGSKDGKEGFLEALSYV